MRPPPNECGAHAAGGLSARFTASSTASKAASGTCPAYLRRRLPALPEGALHERRERIAAQIVAFVHLAPGAIPGDEKVRLVAQVALQRLPRHVEQEMHAGGRIPVAVEGVAGQRFEAVFAFVDPGHAPQLAHRLEDALGVGP